MTPRLLKVIVQPIYAVESDGELEEVAVQPVPMSAAQWKGLDPETWAKEGAEAVEAQVAPVVEKEL